MSATQTTPANVNGYFMLPTEPQNISAAPPSPLTSRVFLMGLPKVGKTTLAAQWAPTDTLLLDLQHGTDLLPGDHYVKHITNWSDFEQACDLIAGGGHQFKTIVIDTIDLVWKFADANAAARKGQVAAGLIDYGKGIAETEGLFRRSISKLLARRDLGIWFIGHARRDTTDSGGDKFSLELDRRVQAYITGECDHILFAEKIGNATVLHTQPTPRYPDVGSRLDLPEPLAMDARALYGAMLASIKTLAAVAPQEVEKAEKTTKDKSK